MQPSEIVDLRKAECPSCGGKLRKVPGAKTKCPGCGQFMFVRTRPDNTRVVVTKNEADQIEEEWSIAGGYHEEYLAGKQIVVETRTTLKKQFGGKEPSEGDVQWALLNQELMEHAAAGDWGLYRNSKLRMAEQLRKEEKFKYSFATFLEVCYLDLNGPRNNGGIRHDEELLRMYPPFSPNESFLAPGLIQVLKRMMGLMAVDLLFVEDLYIEHNQEVCTRLGLPQSPNLNWSKLKAELTD